MDVYTRLLLSLTGRGEEADEDEANEEAEMTEEEDKMEENSDRCREREGISTPSSMTIGLSGSWSTTAGLGERSAE